MASIRKDTAAARSAAARRRQRVASSVVVSDSVSSSARSALNDRTDETNSLQQQSSWSTASSLSRSHTTRRPPPTDYAAAAPPASGVSTRTSPAYLTRTPAISTTTSTTTTLPVSSDPLREQSHEVAEEAASILASVRKRQSSSTDRSAETRHDERRAPQTMPKTTTTTTTTKTKTASPVPLTRDRSYPEKLVHEEDDDDEEDQEETIEEMEPIVFDASIDAACLSFNKSPMLIRTHAVNRTLQVELELDDDDEEKEHAEYYVANANGLGVRPEKQEVWQLAVIGGASSSSPSSSSGAVLRYGDRVSLRSTIGKNLALGVRPTVLAKQGGSVITFQVGCFRASTTNQGTSAAAAAAAQQWTVLRAVRDGIVRVGQAALKYSAANKKRRGPTAPVRSGDAILLRNCKTGGLLSVQEDGTLKLVTDSYDSDRIRNGSSEDPTLLGRLRRHTKYVPSENDIFHLVLSAVPKTPLWISGGTTDRRKFLDGSYLLDKQRHEDNSVLDASLFGISRSSLQLVQSDEMKAIRIEQLNTFKGQELALLDEVLGSFLGLEGQFIRIAIASQYSERMDKVEFRLEDSAEVAFDASLRGLVEEILSLSTSYVRVRHFVSSHFPGYEFGSIMQALCETLDLLLRDYVCFIGSLEQQCRQDGSRGLGLRNLQVAVSPSLHSMAVLERVTDGVRNKKGGALINALRDLKTNAFEGDAVADQVLRQLLDAAAAPYMRMLGKWLRCGILDDPFEEFMIKQNDTKSWEHKYVLVESHVLNCFLSTNQTVERVLATGRYWNAVRSCKAGEKSDKEKVGDSDDLLYSSNVAVVSSFVQSMYNEASKALLRLLLEDSNLVGSLRLMKRYFLLDQGDFFVTFLDAAEDELLKEIPNLSLGRIQHWLNLSVQLTEYHGEEEMVSPIPDNELSGTGMLSPSSLRCRFAPESLMDHLDELHAATGGIDTNEPPTPLRHAYGGMSPDGLSGLDALMLDFLSVPFPNSLVLSPSVLGSYQLLFRHLFFAKYVERRLVGIWQNHQTMKELQSLRGSLGPTFLLRQRMLHFVQNLIYYMMFEVIEPNWLEMEAAIISPPGRKEQTVDDILEVHSNFLQKTLEAVLLTNRELVRALTKLMTTCLLFSDQMKRFMKATKIEDDKRAVANEKQKAVQRNLNDRGGSRASLSRKFLQESMQNARLERQQHVQRQTARVSREVSSESYQRMIARFDQVFSDNLCDFMLQLKYSDDLFHSHKVNLAIRLDYNGYVTTALGLASKKP